MADSTIPAASVIRFAVFELDLQAGELRKNGVRLKLEGQPLQVLALLLESRGQLVTREELKKNLWPDDTFVDFDHSINTAVKRLRQVLDDSADTPRFIETLPRRGYRFIHPLNGQPAAEPQPRHHTWVFIVLAVAILAGVVVGLNLQTIRERWFGPGAAASIRSLAVLPLENLTGDPEQEYVADGIHDELLTQLAEVGALKVISRTSVLRYKKSSKSLPEIARELGVDGIVESAVRRRGDHLHVTAQLIQATGDRHLWAHSYDSEPRSLSLLPRQIASDIAGVLRVELSQQEKALFAAAKPVDAAAYNAYLKGHYYNTKWTNDGFWKAIRCFQQALDVDPTYAQAWAGMGGAYEGLSAWANGTEISPKDATAKAKAALQRAIELDPTLRKPHQTLARILRREGDWEGSAREFQRARELDPKWLGPETYLLVTGRYDEAIAAARATAERDPLAYNLQLTLGLTYFHAHRYDEAIAQLKKTVQLDPDIPLAHYELGWSYAKKSMADEAAAECDTAQALQRRKQPDVPFVTSCGWVYAAAGRRQQALDIAHNLEESGGKPTKFADPGDKKGLVLARIYDALGERERALAYLRDLHGGAGALLYDPVFSDAIKADPRFQELARQQRGYPLPIGALAEVRAKDSPAAKEK